MQQTQPDRPNQMAAVNPFVKAEKKRAFIKIAISGPSGSGKTYSALKLMRGMLGPNARIALIDTEHDSASLYADLTPFDTLNIDPPYTIDKYVAAIRAALQHKYDGLIIDSISHAWAGEGGLLEQKESLDARGGKGERNKFANWGQISKQHEQFKAWLLKADIHMICCMRSKQDYVIGEGNKVTKVGMAAVQREGMEYEFTVAFDLAMDHTAAAGKDRTAMYDQKIFIITEDTGRDIMAWRNEGIEAPKPKPFQAPLQQRMQPPKQQHGPQPKPQPEPGSFDAFQPTSIPVAPLASNESKKTEGAPRSEDLPPAEDPVIPGDIAIPVFDPPTDFEPPKEDMNRQLTQTEQSALWTAVKTLYKGDTEKAKTFLTKELKKTASKDWTRGDFEKIMALVLKEEERLRGK